MMQWLESLVRDVGYAMRGLRRQPAFAVIAMATLAVGTTALASVLSIAYAVLGRGLPYPTADRLVQIEQVTDGVGRVEVSPVDVLALREGSPSLERVTLAWFSASSVAGGSFPERAQQVLTDSHAFAMLGVPPLLGRLPGPADDDPGARVVIIGYGLWVGRFGSDQRVVGRVVRIDGEPYTVIAVMPRGFAFPAPYWVAGDLWLMRGPSHPQWPDSRVRVVLAFGLLRAGRAASDAQHEATAVAASLDARYPSPTGPVGLRVTSWAEAERDDARGPLALFAAAAAMVFAIVCVNVLNLLLGRVLDRRRELATRMALGAGRLRVVQQLAAEAAVLFAVGGLAGVAAAVGVSRTFASAGTLTIPRAREATVDATVAALALAIVFAAALIVGLLLAPQAAAALSTGPERARGASAGPRLRRLRAALVAIQIGLSFVLLCGSGVLLEGALALARVDPGFDPRGLQLARVTLPPVKYRGRDEQAAFHQRVIERLRATPGVIAAGAVDVLPATGGAGGPSVLLDGDPAPALPRDLRRADIRVISDGYFETLGLTSRAGRFFAASDARGAPVAIVNEAFAARYLRGQPVGQRLRVTLRGTASLDATARTIVGVVTDLKEETIYRPAPPTVYVPIGQAPTIRLAFLLRTVRDGVDGAAAVREAVAVADPDLASFGHMTLEEAIARELSFNQFNLVLVGALSAASLFLSGMGVYGVMAHAVRHRAREIGIRVALGLTPAGVRRRVIGEGAWLAAAGIAFGLVGAIWGADVLRSMVHGIDRTSTATFLVAAVVLAVAVLAGCYVPARRASRLDPARVLAAGL
jgi:putative ABC transport system permease protein